MLDVEAGQLDTIYFRLNKNANIKVQICNCEGFIVKTIYEGKTKKGQNMCVWDGYDDAGDKVAGGDYYLLINAFTKQEHALYDPYLLPWGDLVDAENFIIDRSNLHIYYMLHQPALVRIRAGVLKEGLLYRTIINWEPRLAGPNTEVWDGFDNSHIIDVNRKDDVEYSLQAYSLPANVIFVMNGNTKLKEYLIKRELPVSMGSYHHSLHVRSRCRDPQLVVSMPTSRITEDGMPLLSDNVILRVEIPERDLQFIENERFEYLFFLDEEYLFSEENAYSPFNYELAIAELPQGEHLLTVIVASSGDHASSGSLKFFVEKRRR